MQGTMLMHSLMLTTHRLFQVVLAALTFLALPARVANAAAPSYQVTDLGVNGGILADVGDINNSGQIVGTMFAAGISTNGTYPDGSRNRAFRTDDPVLDRVADNLGLPPSLQSTGGNGYAMRINNSGQVLAWAAPLNATGPIYPWHSYLVPPRGTLSNATDLGTAGNDFNYARDMNDLGQVVGRVDFGAYLYTSGSPLQALGTLGGGYSEAFGINNLGQITGSAENSAGFPRAFRTAPNAIIAPADDLGSLGGKYVNGRVINDAGQVAGLASIADESASHLFRTQPNADINPATDDLGTLPGGTYIEPLDINASGDLVGWADCTVSSQHAFVVLGSTLYDLNNLIDPALGITLQVAAGINDRGDIVARGTIPGSIYGHAFLLTTNVPSSSISYAVNQAIVTGSVSARGSAEVALSTTFSGGWLFYTLDGSDPALAGVFYTGPFTVDQTSVLRTIAYTAGFTQSVVGDPLAIVILPTLTGWTDGGGSVAIEPAAGAYFSNALALVTATAAPGWTFLQWLGDATGTNPAVSLDMTRNKTVRAVFGTTLNTTVVGGGNIAVSPASPWYPYGSQARITALPATGNYLLLWANAASGQTNNPLTFTITNANPTVTAVFAGLGGPQSAALTVIPDGRGQVTLTPPGNRFELNTNVVLQATPDAGQAFLGWVGAASGSNNPLVVTMNSNKVITASFTKRPWLHGEGNPDLLSQDGFRLTLTGEFGVIYNIFGSTDFSGWVPLGAVTNIWGTVQFTDAEAARILPQRFYRAKEQTP